MMPEIKGQMPYAERDAQCMTSKRKYMLFRLTIGLMGNNILTLFSYSLFGVSI